MEWTPSITTCPITPPPRGENISIFDVIGAGFWRARVGGLVIGHAVIATVEWCKGEVVCVGTLYNHSTSTRPWWVMIYTYMIHPNVFVFY